MYLQNFGSASKPLKDEIHDITLTDSDHDGSTSSDYFGDEKISYNLGSGTQTANIDSIAIVSGTVTFGNGSTATVSNMVMFQDTLGNLFLTNSDFSGTDIKGPGGIQSVDITEYDNSYVHFGLEHKPLQGFVCFASGTRIETPSGSVMIDDLSVGDRVVTKDRGAQEILWVGQSDVQQLDRTAPILIRAGSLGPDMPSEDLYLSRQHRVLLKSPIAERMFEQAELLVPAHRLCVLPGVERSWNGQRPRYFHVFTGAHDILLSNGTYSESLFLGPQAANQMGAAARSELSSLYPGVFRPEGRPRLARFEPSAPRARRLLSRHLNNNKNVWG